jgi:hypothetical protein
MFQKRNTPDFEHLEIMEVQLSQNDPPLGTSPGECPYDGNRAKVFLFEPPNIYETENILPHEATNY